MCERERDCGDDHLLIGFTMMGFPMLAFLLLIEEFGGVGSGAGVVGVSAGGWVNRRRGSCRPLVYTASSSRHLVTCHASDKSTSKPSACRIEGLALRVFVEGIVEVIQCGLEC